MRVNEARPHALRADARTFDTLPASVSRAAGHRAFRWLATLFLSTGVLACGSSGGEFADTGGMSGTGISQGSISAFGSIFVNGVEWDLTDTTVEIDGASASEDDLRLGMVVRIEGDFDASGATGTAISVVFDDSLEGPIENDPVDLPGGLEKSFRVLGTTVVIHETGTVFDEGASFAGLAADDVVEVSGFTDEAGAIRATRVELKGAFPGNAAVELRGTASNVAPPNPDGSGDFNLGTILVHYTAGTSFSDVTRESLANGDLVEVEGTLRLTGDEIDANEIELEDEGLGDGDAEDVEIEGFVTSYVSLSSFRVAGVLVDASNASFEPPGLSITNGSRLEVGGRLEAGVLIAEEVESEDDDEDEDEVRIDAAVSNVDPISRELTILGVTVTADGETRIEDERDGDDNFRFDEIEEGDWLEIRGTHTGSSTVRAVSIERDEEEDDVLLEGPVTGVDNVASSLSILGQDIPLYGGTSYFDESEQSRTEEQFFRGPNPVAVDDIVRATDFSAADPEILEEADEVEIQDD